MVCRRSVGQSHMGHAGRRCQNAAAFTSSPCPSPGRGFRLSVALWRVPAVTPLVYTASREPVRREGDKSLKLYPCERLTFNRAKWSAGDRIGAWRAEYPRRIAYSPPRKPPEIPPSGGFCFLDDEPNKSIMPPKFCGGAIQPLPAFFFALQPPTFGTTQNGKFRNRHRSRSRLRRQSNMGCGRFRKWRRCHRTRSFWPPQIGIKGNAKQGIQAYAEAFSPSAGIDFEGWRDAE